MLQNYMLKVYVIHDDAIKYREPNMNNTLKTLQMVCNTIGMRFASIIINKPTIDILQKRIQELNSKVKYEKIGDPEFDQRMGVMSIEQISNIEKHKEAWMKISEDEDNNTIHMVIEDDAFIMNEFIVNIMEFLKSLPSIFLTPKREWDICFLGNTQCMNTSPDNQIRYTNTRDATKIFPSKESYIVAPSIIRRMNNFFDTIRYTLRIHMSLFIHTNQDIRSVFPTKPLMLDGSKIGLFTSTIHPMNPLILNKEFMELWQLQNKKEVTIAQIRNTYKKLEHMKSPDVLHLLGNLFVEKKLYIDADDAYIEAIKLIRLQNGILNTSCFILNNAITNYKYLQKDYNQYKNKPSKYIEPDVDVYVDVA